MASSWKIRHGSLTDVGVKRSHNQDACAVQPAADEAMWQLFGHIFIVADGMGGHAVGEKASAMAVRSIPLIYQKHVQTEGVVTAINRAFEETNSAIYEIGKNNPEFKGLGTTSTALFLRPDGAWFGHVGDSRAYRIRKGKVEQLTFDHSWVWEVARRQGIDPDELGDFKKNVIIRSLGPDETVEVDIEGPHPAEPGDVFLLCSDGLSNLVPPDEIGAVVAALPPSEACQFLVELANFRGGPDNITCLIVQVPVPGQDVGNDVKGKKRSGGGFAGKVNRALPWPFLALGVGSIATLASVYLRANELSGSIPLFLLAAVGIVTGLVGLFVHLKKSAASAPAEPDATFELRVYKSYTVDSVKPIYDRFDATETELKATLKERDTPLDWTTYEKLSAEAVAKFSRNEFLPAFRSKCLGFQILAAAANKDRNKEEAFQPNWTASAASKAPLGS
ncbi:MAG TPA: protein phosphatase 2C domain-containing protein [Fimbriiglobus sp.]